MNNVDILTIDAQIHKNFDIEAKKLDMYRHRLSDLHITLQKRGLSIHIRNTLLKGCENLKKKIDDILTDKRRNFYIAESIELIEEYKNILRKPLKISFTSLTVRNNTEKKKIISKYLKIAQKYVSVNIYKKKKKAKLKIVCEGCENKEDFVVDGNIYICVKCGEQQESTTHYSSYTDINRVNIFTKYTYDRKVHFRDGIYQYQGKQNSTIDQKVYEDLEDQFDKHHLLIGDKKTPKEVRFRNIKKAHIYMFLGETGHTKHYEDVNLIYHNFTGVPLDDISHLEDNLLEDFDKLTELYDRKFKYTKKIDRKNFLNTQYILYQFLKRYKHPCRKEDFNMLKTIELKALHDELCTELFRILDWNIFPIF